MKKLIIASEHEPLTELAKEYAKAEPTLKGLKDQGGVEDQGYELATTIEELIGKLGQNVLCGNTTAIVADVNMGNYPLYEFFKENPMAPVRAQLERLLGANYLKVIRQVGNEIPIIFMTDLPPEAVEEITLLEDAIHTAIPKPKIALYGQSNYQGAMEQLGKFRPEFREP